MRGVVSTLIPSHPRPRMRRGLTLGLLVLSTFGCERSLRTGPPDIILISVDTLRPDHLGAYGNEQARTPQIDALATNGTTFVNAFAPMGRTTPSSTEFSSPRSSKRRATPPWGSRETARQAAPALGPLSRPALAVRASARNRGYDCLLITERHRTRSAGSKRRRSRAPPPAPVSEGIR